MKKTTKKRTAGKQAPSARNEDPIMNCPRCSVKMQKFKKNNVTLDVCPSCKGMWLDAGEIEKLASQTRH